MQVTNINVAVHCSHELSAVVEKDHPCGRLHGHTYHISLEVSYENNPRHLVMDFGVIKKLIKDRYCHRHLNDVMSLPPTAENFAKDICEFLTLHISSDVTIRHVTVGETENNITTYVPEDAEANEMNEGE